MFLSVGDLCPQCKIGHIYPKGKREFSSTPDWTLPTHEFQKSTLVCDKCGHEVESLSIGDVGHGTDVVDIVAIPEKNVLRLVNVGNDGEFPIPHGYELVEPLKLEAGEYFATFFVMPTGEPRIAFYTVKWPNGKPKTYGHQVAQARLRLKVRDTS